MPRSNVLTGRTKQLDRARQRNRLDRHRRERGGSLSDEGKAALEAWMEANIPVDELAAIERLDLDGFVCDTASFDLAPEERLGLLAIFLRHEITSRRDQPRGWLALDRIHTAAVKLESRSMWLHYSRTISARECAQSFEWECEESPEWQHRQEWADFPVRGRLMKAAYDASHEVLRLAPDEAESLYLMGWLLCEDSDRSPEEALEWFDRALVLDSDHGWSRLYRAYCLHDIKRWAEAAEAYDVVPPAFFVGFRAWRYEYLLEERASCRLEAGQVDRAREEFEALLTRWEQNPHLARQGWHVHLAEAARGPLREALFHRTLALFELVGRDGSSPLIEPGLDI